MGYDTWAEIALIAITKEGTNTNVAAGAFTEDISGIDIGEKGFETIVALSGARMVRFTPQGDIELTFKMWPMEAGTESGTTMKGVFDLLHPLTPAASLGGEGASIEQPLICSLNRIRTKYRIAIMWTDKVSETDATAEIAGSSNEALRLVAAEGYFTAAKPSFDDKGFSVEVTYKAPPFDSLGNANAIIQSVVGSGTLTALTTYTGGAGTNTKGWTLEA